MAASCREYDDIAWLYNRYWGREYPPSAMCIMEKLLLPKLSQNSSILDLCCGTGHVTKLLCDRRLKTVGLDGSPSMLRYARENAPAALFMAADARNFALRDRFDAVISTFEAMNHILEEKELALVFDNVSAVLGSGGAFLFDVLTEEAYRAEWAKSSSIVEEDVVCITRGGFEPETAIARAEVTAFVRDVRCWKRTDVTVHERCYPAERIISLLVDSGFKTVKVHDARSLGMTGSLGVGRQFILADKP